MPLTSGASFAGYRIQRLLGTGGMGEVYLAQHPRLPRLDALKILPATLTDDAQFRQRFGREADLAATLYHPNIVGIHDRGEHEGQLWISMDFVDGTDAARLARDYNGPLPVDDVLQIVEAVADALDFAHRSRLLHRDVKPSNILLTSPRHGHRRVLLADFGIARHTDDVSGLTSTNVAVGTVTYAAPEQLMGEDIDGRADLYALAATAYHLLAGRPPFVHSNPAVLISRHLNQAAAPLSHFRPEVVGLDEVLALGLAKEAASRPRTCSEFSASLRMASQHRTAPRAISGWSNVAASSDNSGIGDATMSADAFAAMPTGLGGAELPTVGTTPSPDLGSKLRALFSSKNNVTVALITLGVLAVGSAVLGLISVVQVGGGVRLAPVEEPLAPFPASESYMPPPIALPPLTVTVNTPCEDVGKVLPAASGEALWCDVGSRRWAPAPFAFGDAEVGSPCPTPSAFSKSHDGYVVVCDGATRAWARWTDRPAGN